MMCIQIVLPLDEYLVCQRKRVMILRQIYKLGVVALTLVLEMQYSN